MRELGPELLLLVVLLAFARLLERPLRLVTLVAVNAERKKVGLEFAFACQLSSPLQPG
jgi:hypothetical protein